MLGVLVNAIVVVIGALIGIVLKRGISEKISDAIMKGLSLCVMYIGWSGTMECQNTLILIISMVIGAIIGEAIDIDKAVNSFAKSLEEKFFKKSGGKVSFAKGFVSATLLFCVGAMAVVGSIQSGLEANHETLFAKSLMDFIASIILASTMGIGVAAAAIPVLLYQGVIALGASFLSGVLTDVVVAQMTAVGSLLIFGLGANMAGVSNFKIMNYLPAVFIPIILCQFM